MSNLASGSYIDGTDIYLRHGDSFYVALSILTPEGETYLPGEGDVLHTQCRSEDQSQLLWDCVIPGDTLQFRIAPEYSRDKDCKTKWFYDVQIEFANGDIQTVIPKSRVVLLPEITLKDEAAP